MSKVSCNIIKDLLPSYLEDICSEDTKKFVNSHLKECEDCNALTKMMQRTEFVSEQADRKIVDSMKKVKKHIRKIVGLGIWIGLVGIGMAMYLERYGMIPVSFYYIVMPVFLIILHSILLDYHVKQKITKWNIGLGMVEVGVIGYSILLEFLSLKWVESGNYPFGLEESRIGLFLSYQFWISTAVQGGIFAAGLWGHIRKGVSYRMVMNGCILGMGINLAYLSLLRQLDTLEEFVRIRNQTLGGVLGEWGLIVGVLGVISFHSKKKL